MTASPAAPLAERLGLAAGERVAIVHCDDLGMCEAANRGALAALREGAATCGSVMVPAPAFEAVAAEARRDPSLDLGVHLTLNAEFATWRWGPVLGDAVPSLLDAEGRLPRTTTEVLERARPEEVERELRAQIDRALEAGIDVTHLDAHMGTVLVPPLTEVYVQLGLDYRLPVFAVHPDAATLAALGADGARVDAALERLVAGGIPLLDGFDADSLEFPPGDGLAHNRERLEKLGPGVSYFICHPAAADDEAAADALEAITPDAHARAFEARFWGGGEGRRELERRGIATLGMRPLRALVRGGA